VKALPYRSIVVAILSIALVAYVSIANAEQYLCVADKSVGFAYDKVTKAWDNANFSTDAKYLVSESKEPKYAYQITRIGTNYRLASCKQDFNKYGYLVCPDVAIANKFYDFSFNRISSKFLLIFPYGYIDVTPDERNASPYMEIGKCSPF